VQYAYAASLWVALALGLLAKSGGHSESPKQTEQLNSYMTRAEVAIKGCYDTLCVPVVRAYASMTFLYACFDKLPTRTLRYLGFTEAIHSATSEIIASQGSECESDKESPDDLLMLIDIMCWLRIFLERISKGGKLRGSDFHIGAYHGNITPVACYSPNIRGCPYLSKEDRISSLERALFRSQASMLKKDKPEAPSSISAVLEGLGTESNSSSCAVALQGMVKDNSSIAFQVALGLDYQLMQVSEMVITQEDSNDANSWKAARHLQSIVSRVLEAFTIEIVPATCLARMILISQQCLLHVFLEEDAEALQQAACAVRMVESNRGLLLFPAWCHSAHLIGGILDSLGGEQHADQRASFLHNCSRLGHKSMPEPSKELHKCSFSTCKAMHIVMNKREGSK
jgi:hypothetical protein